MAEKVGGNFSRQELKKYRGNIGAAYPFLELLTNDMVYWYDDFLGDTIRGDATSPGCYEIKTTTDGDVAIVADQTNGIVKLRTDADGTTCLADEYVGLSLPELGFKGDLNCCMSTRLYVDTITGVKVEIGFTDVTTDAGAVNTLGTYLYRADNHAVWILDTDDTAYFQCVGTKTTTEATKLEPGTAWTHTGAIFNTYTVRLHGDDAKFYIHDANGYLIYESAWQADFIEGGTKVCPWIFVQARTTSSRYLYIDFLKVWQRRTST